jgi:hypothetical protein
MAVADTDTKLAAENARLRAELAALKAKARDDEPERRVIAPDTEAHLKDAFSRNRHEVDRIGRGLAYAAVESLHAQADSLTAAADRLFRRTSRSRAGKDTDELIPGANDVAEALSAALDSAADHGSRIVHRFVSAYDKADGHARHPVDKQAG